MEDLRTQFTVSFGVEPIAAPVEYVCGLGEAEGWGRWNNDTRVSIRFEGNLPRAFEAHIACAVTSGNIGRAITVIAGGCCRKFVSTRTLRDGLAIARLAFGSSERARTLEILIPSVGPESSSDPRFLGLALGSLSIVPRVRRGLTLRAGANG